MKNILLCIARFLDLAPSEYEKKMVEKIKNSYSSLRVSSRGVVSVSADEVINNPEFQDLYPKKEAINKISLKAT